MNKSNVFKHILPLSSNIIPRTPKFKPNYSMYLDAISIPKQFTTRDTVKHVLELSKEKEPFYVVHLSNLESQYERWTQNLPNVVPHYAVKSNPDRRIIQTLNSLGTKFDCASMKEIQEVLSITKDPKKIIFAHPFKIPHHLEFASSVGVERVTADNVSELEKLRFFHKNAKILIRMKPDDSNSLCKFSTKFGATSSEAIEMLEYAQKFNMDVIGTSFHVGSGCQSSQSYIDIILECSKIFEYGIDLGFEMKVLDIGGGFPGLNMDQSGDSFEQMCVAINESVTKFFSKFKDLEVIGEPGRYFSGASSSVVLSVIGKKAFQDGDKSGFKYYIDDGIYGGFNCMIFDHQKPKLEILKPRLVGNCHTSVVFGPTCDSMDTLGEYMLPELYIGDRLFVDTFGSYTTASGSQFNGFKNVKRFYVYKE